ncbi:MAG: VWA domain-containing protein [Peptostreptococcaceae bacterium]|nr:VWA domain-containing protein [Peptostreptococcaceae bacterium]
MKNYPFEAIVGGERPKLALTLLAVNSSCKSLLLLGGRGSGKTSMIRAWGEILPDQKLVEVPLNVTMDRLIGGEDLSERLKGNRIRIHSGLLTLADGNVLYTDDVHLQSDAVLRSITQAHFSGKNRICREGLDKTCPGRFVWVASMDPSEEISASVLQNFGLCVRIEEADLQSRMEILRRQWLFEQDEESFCKSFQKARSTWQRSVRETRSRLSSVKIPHSICYEAARLCNEARSAGNDVEKLLIETARAYAAWLGMLEIEEEHLKLAASFVLPHRMRSIEEPQSLKEQEPRREDRERAQNPAQEMEWDRDTILGQTDPEDQTEKIRPFSTRIKLRGTKKLRRSSSRGKRSKYRSILGSGRYVDHAAFKKLSGSSIAFDATIREAAKHQFLRSPKAERAIDIRLSDLRVKIREERQNAVILFVVDASASMGAHKRMGAVKGAVLAMLSDAYRNRDEVGMIAFRKDQAELVLPITRSPFLAKKRLEQLPTGGKTPLAKGLETALQTLKARSIRNPGETQFLILLSDGRANVPLEQGNDAVADAKQVAEKIAETEIFFAVLDTETSFIRMNMANEIARSGKGTYIRLEDISGEEIENIVIEIRRNKK